jgi:hypothetical protein
VAPGKEYVIHRAGKKLVMMIIPAKFKLAAIVSVAVISVSAGAVGSSPQQAKPGITLSESQLSPMVGTTDQGGRYSPSVGSMLLGSDESEWLVGVRGVLGGGPGDRVRIAACAPRGGPCFENSDCCSRYCIIHDNGRYDCE